MKDRIYVCHTYYHVYISFLKEMNLPEEKQGGATLLLSTMTQDFSGIRDRLADSGVFEEVLYFDEKRDVYFPELAPYRNMTGNQFKIMLGRMKYTKLYGKLQEQYVPVDFREYGDIYVFCDNDPIGYYLSYKRIYYHAVEDGLDTLKVFPVVYKGNRRFWPLKKFLSAVNLLFLGEGYGKYCLDMEVNDLEGVRHPNKKYFALPRRQLTEHLTARQKDILIRAFVADADRIKELSGHRDALLVLTEPLCDPETRKQIFRDIKQQFEGEGEIVFKPHPNDHTDYRELFPDNLVLDGKMPMEILNFCEGLHFRKIISVFTELGAIEFAEEKLRLGERFMDKYEDPAKHTY